MESVEHIVKNGILNINIIDYILNNISYFPSKKSVVNALKKKEIKLDGKECRRDSSVQSFQKITYNTNKRTQPKIFKLQLNVVYEDEHLAVVEKLPGYPVNGNKYKTIENSLLFNLKSSTEEDALEWPMPVHRLDLPTGGLLLIAKTKEVQVKLGWQFQQKIIKKKYIALVSGLLEKDGLIDIPLNDRVAITEYKINKKCFSLKNENITMIELSPQTGRYHQLRRHLSMLGHPIIGDKEYSEEGNVLVGKGLFLWAVELYFRHPKTEKVIDLKISPPDKFENFMEREERRWKKYN